MLSEADIRLLLDKTGKGRNCFDETKNLEDYLPKPQEIPEVKEPIKKPRKGKK